MKNLISIILFLFSINISSLAFSKPLFSTTKSYNIDYGTYIYPNGDEYVGFFKNDKFHGLGTFTWVQGESFTGLWENGYMTEKGTYTYKDGTTENFSETIRKWKKIKNNNN